MELKMELVDKIIDVTLERQKEKDNTDYLEMSDLVVDVIDYIDTMIDNETHKVGRR